MTRRLTLAAVLFTLLAGCSENVHKPLGRDLVLDDLRLSAHLSSNQIAHGDTLLIEMTAYNPYSKPLDVTFIAYGCYEWFWVYDEQGELVSPQQLCLDSSNHELESDFHMDPLEERHFTHEWVACGVNPGHCSVVTGFNAPLGGSPHTAHPIEMVVLPSDEDVSGTWSGSFCCNWRGQHWWDNYLTLTLAQTQHIVSGTLFAGSSTFQIQNGRVQDNGITFSVSDESADVLAEFTGDVCRNRLGGRCRILDALSREVLDEVAWNVWDDE
jgi:uncharacterized protein YcfL